MLRRLVFLISSALILMILGVVPVNASATGAEKVDVVQEWTLDGDPIKADHPSIGFTTLVRKPSGISGTTHVEGLHPDGVYTFWVVAFDPLAFADPTNPDFSLVYADNGGYAVVGQNGRATVHWSADSGASSIDTSAVFGPPLGVLADPLTRGVRVEIAYHGQVPEDGVVPSGWISNFWDGDAPEVCPDPPFVSGGPIIAAQPHCPVFFASTHLPVG